VFAKRDKNKHGLAIVLLLAWKRNTMPQKYADKAQY